MERTSRMAKVKDHSTSYKEALKKLLDYFNTEFRNGGRLPSVREMSRRFGVSMKTYHKALQVLCREGLAYSEYRSAGTFVVPAVQRRKKIALVIENGTSSGFLAPSQTLLALLNRFMEEEILLQLISGVSPEAICEDAGGLGVNAILWYSPPIQIRENLETIATASEVPLIVFSDNLSYLDSGIPVVVRNEEFAYTVKAECIRKFCRKNFLVFVQDHKYIAETLDDYRKAGIALIRENCFLADDIPNLSRIISERGIDFILADCNIRHFQAMVEILKMLPGEERPLVIPNMNRKSFLEFKAEYPQTPGRFVSDTGAIGTALGEEICRHLATGEKFKTVIVNSAAFLAT